MDEFEALSQIASHTISLYRVIVPSVKKFLLQNKMTHSGLKKAENYQGFLWICVVNMTYIETGAKLFWFN